MLSEKIREDRQRRRLARAGYALAKTPARSWLRAEYGPGYEIMQGNTVVAGCSQRTANKPNARPSVSSQLGLPGSRPQT